MIKKIFKKNDHDDDESTSDTNNAEANNDMESEIEITDDMSEVDQDDMNELYHDFKHHAFKNTEHHYFVEGLLIFNIYAVNGVTVSMSFSVLNQDHLCDYARHVSSGVAEVR